MVLKEELEREAEENETKDLNATLAELAERNKYIVKNEDRFDKEVGEICYI